MSKTRAEFRSKIPGAKDKLHKAAAQGLLEAVEFLLGEANKEVPHDEGALERSGQASVDESELLGAVSYDTPYAVRQHEDMALHHQGKGKAKWLEGTFDRERGTAGQILAQAIKSEVSHGA